MQPIKREDIPDKCPGCQSRLESYYGPGLITRIICSNHCSEYAKVIIIDHEAELRGDKNAILLCTLNNLTGE